MPILREQQPMREQQSIPNEARKMHGRIFPGETTELPQTTGKLFESLQNSANSFEIREPLASTETNSLLLLLDLLKQEALITEDGEKEENIARKLLTGFGFPYLPGAEEVWLTLTGYLANAKEATEQTQFQLKQTIDQIRTLLIAQLVTDQENQLEALKIEKEQHLKGIITLGKTSDKLAEEAWLTSQKDGAITQKKERLIEIEIKKRQIKNSIESMRAWISSLFANFSQLEQLSSAQPVMV